MSSKTTVNKLKKGVSVISLRLYILSRTWRDRYMNIYLGNHDHGINSCVEKFKFIINFESEVRIHKLRVNETRSIHMPIHDIDEKRTRN